ncbi:GTP-binding protein Di-Ras3-like [Sagmatias obliquidens]|uniref:GTP-binding protein Di-Ras3-like n=1 Tax=Sagmatias obliquidens TaxID=3371155 RepID=UPI000F44644A|nr:GTP-binding protein Di-Ras3-like [Lagenorhynchus obliquidens]
MGSSCFGLKERLIKRLRPLPTLTFIRTCLPQRRSRDFRVVVVGSTGVGKSALVQRCVRGNFREAYLPTIEDTHLQALGCSHKAGTMHTTDTTGGRRYQATRHCQGHVFILVYSVTKKQTLEELKPLYELIRQLKGNSPQKCAIILVGNKCDESHREVSEKEGAAYASEWNCAFLETSAKMNINVQALF